MADNLSVKITADVADLQTKFAIAKAESSALSSELSKLARSAVAAGGTMSSELKGQLSQAASAAMVAKAQVANLNTELKAGSTHFSNFGSAASLAKEAMGAFGVAMSVGAIVGLGKNIFEAAEQMQHQAEVLGLTVTQYQAFTKSAEFSGVAVESVDRALMRFNAAQGAAQQGLGEQAKAFADLGVSANLPAEEALPAVARALLAMTDNARRARDEVILFGRAGEELTPALERWAEGVDVLAAALEKTHNLLDPKMAAAARAADAQMSQVFDAMKTNYTPDVILLSHALTGLAEAYNDFEKWSHANPFLKGFLHPVESLAGALGPKKNPSESTATGDPFHVGDKTYDRSGIADEELWDFSGKAPPDKAGEAAAKQAAEKARQTADEVAQAYQQGNERHLESEQQTNNSLLEMGQESVAQWQAQAVELENARYAAEVAYYEKKKGLDAGDKDAVAKDAAEEAQLFQEHTDKLLAVTQEANQKQRAIDDADVAAFAQDQEKKLQAALTTFDAEFKSGQLSAQQRHDLEIGLTQQVEQEVLARFDAEHAGLVQGTQAYADAMKQRQALVDQFNAHVTAANNQLDEEQQAVWKQLGTSIEGSLNSAIDGMALHGKTFGQTMMQLTMGIAGDFLQAGEKIVENWAMSMIMSEISSKTSQETQVTNAAGLAAANTMASISAIPMIGPFMAPEMAEMALAQTMAFGQFEQGANVVPNDMIAQIHAGERIIPAADNSALMAAVGAKGGGGDTHNHYWNYSPTNNVTSGRNGMQDVKDSPGEFISFVQGLARNGKLSFG